MTGGTGFLGTPLTMSLSADGHEVHVASRGSASMEHVQSHSTDLLNPRKVSKLIAEVLPTHLVHLAWITDPQTYLVSPENVLWRDASLNLLQEFAKKGGTRALMAGTCLEYSFDGGACHEDLTPLQPMTLYAQMKHSLHTSATELARSLGVSFSWARLFYLYGPREDPRRLVAHVLTSILRGKEAHISEGSQRRDYLYVDDAAVSLAALLHTDFPGPVNIGSGRAVAVRELAEAAAKSAGDPSLLQRGLPHDATTEPALIEADTSRIREITGWIPSTSFPEGLKAARDWWSSRI